MKTSMGDMARALTSVKPGGTRVQENQRQDSPSPKELASPRVRVKSGDRPRQ